MLMNFLREALTFLGNAYIQSPPHFLGNDSSGFESAQSRTKTSGNMLTTYLEDLALKDLLKTRPYQMPPVTSDADSTSRGVIFLALMNAICSFCSHRIVANVSEPTH